jgi:hypothetical protein
MSAQLVPVDEHDYSLSRQVRLLLESSDETDPAVIATQMIATMSLADARMALAATLPGYVRNRITAQRTSPIAVGMPVGSARWDNVAQLHADGSLTLLRQRVFAQGSWKFLGDCSRDDVGDLVAVREADAQAVLAVAARYKNLRAAMDRRNAGVVSDLPGDVLNEIFDA